MNREQVIEKIAEIVRVYVNQVIDVVVNAKMPDKDRCPLDIANEAFLLIEQARLVPELKVLDDERLEKLLDIDFKTAYSGHVLEYQDVAKAQRDYDLQQIGEANNV